MMNKSFTKALLVLSFSLLSGCFGFDRDSTKNPGTNDRADSGTPAKIEITIGEIQTVFQGQIPVYALQVKDKYNDKAPYADVRVYTPDESFDVTFNTDANGENLALALSTLNKTGRIQLIFEPVVSSGTPISKTVELVILTVPHSLSVPTASTKKVASTVSISGQLKDTNAIELPFQTITVAPVSGTFQAIPTTVVTDALGNYSFDIVLGTQTQNYSLKLTAGSVEESLTYSTVPEALSSVVVASGNNQTLTAGQTPSDLVVDFKDVYGNGISGLSTTIWGQSVSSNASGRSTFSLGTRTVAGAFEEDLVIDSFTIPVKYTVNPSAPATIDVLSGGNQVLARGQVFDPVVVQVLDAYGNAHANLPVTFNDGTASIVNTDDDGVASKAYSFSTVGTKSIAITASTLSTSTSLEVKDYSPTSLTISSADLLEWSEIATFTFGSSNSTSLGNGFTASATTANSSYTYSANAPEVIDNEIPLTTTSSTEAVDITDGSSSVSITPLISLPAGVSSASCEVQSPSFLTSVSCSVSSAFTFLRNQLGLGSFSIKGLSDGFGLLDYKVSNSLPLDKTKVKAWTRQNECVAGDEKARFLFVSDNGVLFRDCGSATLSFQFNPNTSSLSHGSYAFNSSGSNFSSLYFDNDSTYFQQGAGSSGGVIQISPTMVGKRQTFSISTSKEEPYKRGGIIYGFDGTNSKCATAFMGSCPFNSFKGVYLFDSGGESYFWERNGIYGQTGTNRDLIFPILADFTSYTLDTGSTPFKASVTGLAGGANITDYDLGLFDTTDTTQTIVVQFRNHSGGTLTFGSTLSAPNGGWTQQSNTCTGANVSNNGTCFHRVRINPSALTPGVYVAYLTTTRGNVITITATVAEETLSPYPQKIVVDETTKEAFFTFSDFFFHLDAVTGTLKKYPVPLNEKFATAKLNKVWDLGTEVWFNRYDEVADEFVLISYDKVSGEFTEYSNLKDVDYVVKYHDHYYFSGKNFLGKYKDGVFAKVFNERGENRGQVKNNKLYVPTSKYILEICDPDLTTCN